MATIFEKMMELKEQRERASEKSPVSDMLAKTATNIGLVANAVNDMQVAVRSQMAANLAARKTGEAQDVQQAIKNLLQAKVTEDRIERERHNRMMDLAESLVPQVTEEQLKAFRMQQLVAREHKKTLEATVEIEKKKYDLQKKNAEDMQKRRIKAIEAERAEANFAIKDKYGTIESAIGGLGNSGGDSLGKFLVAGLGRYVKEKKETPISEATKEKYDELVNQQNRIAEGKKALADKEFGTKQADINEEFAIRAAKQGIADPGSAAKLYADRAQNVKAVAGAGENLEKQLLAGKVKVSVPNMDKAAKTISQAIREPAKAPPAEIPTLTRSGIESNVGQATAPKAEVTKPTPKSESTKPTPKSESTKAEAQKTAPKATPESRPEIASTLKEPIPQKAPEAPKQMPKNARMQKAPRQSSRLLTPVVKRTPSPQATVNPASTGMFGSKSGAVNLGGIGKSLGGLMKGIWSIAKSATKFLGPWALVANAIMSFDRLVPIVSGLAGSIMDMTKLIMPMIVSSIIETGAQILGGINGLIELFDHSRLFGRGWYKDSEVQSKISEKSAAVEAEQEVQRKTRREVTNGPGVVDTTSAYSRGVRAAVTRKETALTTPSEAAAISEQARAAQAPANNEYQVADWRNQREQNEILRDAVRESARNPGTTPIMVANPVMTPWTA